MFLKSACVGQGTVAIQLSQFCCWKLQNSLCFDTLHCKCLTTCSQLSLVFSRRIIETVQFIEERPKLIETCSLLNSISKAQLQAVVHTVPDENVRKLVDHHHTWLAPSHAKQTSSSFKMSSVKPWWDRLFNQAVWITSAVVSGNATISKKNVNGSSLLPTHFLT